MQLHERLRYARTRAKLNGTQVASRTGIGKSSLSEFETGKREPSLSQLHALAKAYRRSVPFFLSADPIPTEVVLWREEPSGGSSDVEARFLRLCEQYHNLEVWADEQVGGCLPEVVCDAEAFSYADARKLAKDVRDKLQLGDRPALSLLAVLEEIGGVKVFHLPFEPTGTAASTLGETFGPAVLLNSTNRRWRRNFDLAHELFHLLTWHVFRTEAGHAASPAVAGGKEESLADCFASNLLVPLEPLRAAIDPCLVKERKLTFQALFDIARQFDVSVAALLWGIHYAYRTRDDVDRTLADIAKAKEKEPGPLLEERGDTPPPEWPDRYRALAIKVLRRGEMSLGRFAEYLGISRRDAARYNEQEITDDEEVQVSPA